MGDSPPLSNDPKLGTSSTSIEDEVGSSCEETSITRMKKPANSTKRREDQAPLSCDICGEPTNTYHYEVASCNGCMFFVFHVVSKKWAYPPNG